MGNYNKHKHLKLIRGQRILQQLEDYEHRLSETSYADLEQNTMNFIPPSEKRQWATDPIHITEMRLTPYQQSNALEVDSVADSDEKQYQTIILFQDVIFEEQDEGDNVTFTGADEQDYNIIPIRLNDSNVKVRCECLDFRWRFAMYNSRDGSLYGDPPGNYQKKTNRPSVNQRNVPGVCKHLLKTVLAMRDAGLVQS